MNQAITGIKDIHSLTVSPSGSVEKSRQRRSRHFSVLTYSAYDPRVHMTAALPRGGVLHAGLGGLPTLDFLKLTRSL
jgi:hypothetical protein